MDRYFFRRIHLRRTALQNSPKRRTYTKKKESRSQVNLTDLPQKAVKKIWISNNTWNVISSDPVLKFHYTHALKKIRELTPGKYSKDSLISILKKDLPTGPADNINEVVLFDYIE
jgi:hypothetical protein